ncbi:hypothetical protein P4B35_08165 [Pontiellaceae bacterium B12227]|nr:hypothetical protein [Pontiellaceae bacterium B12227]
MEDRSPNAASIRSAPGWYITSAAGGLLAALAAAQHMLAAGAALLMPMLLAAGLLILSHPEWIVWLTVIPSTANDHLGISAGGINLRPYNVLALAGLGWLALNFMIKSRVRALTIFRTYFPLFLPLLAFAGCKVMSVVTMNKFPLGMTPIFSAKYVVFATLLLATAYVTLFMIERRQVLENLIKGWIHMANFVWIVAILQLILSNVWHFHFVHHRSVIWFGRPYSVFREPDVLGSFVGATVLMVLPMLAWRSKLLPARYLWFTLGLHSFLLLILFVRAAWIGTIVGLMVWAASAVRASRFKPVLTYMNRGMAIMVLLIFLLPFIAPGFTETLVGRFASLSNPTEESAGEYRMRELTTMVSQTLPDGFNSESVVGFLFGHGDFSWSYWAPYLLGENYDRAAVEIMQAGGAVLIHPGFCMTLSIFFDNGAAGLSCLIIFFILLSQNYFQTLEKLRGRPKEDLVLVTVTFLPIVCVLTCFQFSYDPITPFLWAMIGMHIAATYFTTTTDRETDFEPMRNIAIRLGLTKDRGLKHAGI